MRMTPVVQIQTCAVFLTIAKRTLFVADNTELYPDLASARMVQMNYGLLVILAYCMQCPELILSINQTLSELNALLRDPINVGNDLDLFQSCGQAVRT
jgi:hypothetical protein